MCLLVSTGYKGENDDWNASYLSLYIRPTDGDADAVQWLLQDELMLLRLLVLHCITAWWTHQIECPWEVLIDKGLGRFLIRQGVEGRHHPLDATYCATAAAFPLH